MIRDSKIVCIIPARGKSKRLPGKNVIDFLGKPLIAHSIITAKQSKYVDEIFVTTDNKEIANISKLYGARIINRPDHLSSDHASTASALKHALLQKDIESFNPYAILMLQPTSPLRPERLIDDCIEAFMDSQPDSLITVSLNKNKLGRIENERFCPVTYTLGQRSQDLPSLYFENGLAYITKSEILLNEDVFGDVIKPFIVNSPFSDIDIDTQEDLDWAEFVAKKHL